MNELGGTALPARAYHEPPLSAYARTKSSSSKNESDAPEEPLLRSAQKKPAKMPRQALTALLPLCSAILHTQTPPQSFHALPRDHLYRAFDGLIVDASPSCNGPRGDASTIKPSKAL